MTVVSNILRFTIDYSKTLEERIAACGLSAHQPTITAKLFPPAGNGIVVFEAKPFMYTGPLEPDCNCCPLRDVNRFIAEADPDRPWEPAHLDHLLGYLPLIDPNRVTTIAATGDAARGTVPYIFWAVRGGPVLWIDSDLEFGSDTDFLGVRLAA
ncbi:MAG: hypothetical protein AAB582_03865 [Patescibacteria group bacterium]